MVFQHSKVYMGFGEYDGSLDVTMLWGVESEEEVANLAQINRDIIYFELDITTVVEEQNVVKDHIKQMAEKLGMSENDFEVKIFYSGGAAPRTIMETS